MEYVGAVGETYDAEAFVRVGTDPGFERSIRFSDVFLRNLRQDRDVGLKSLHQPALFAITHGTVPGDYSHVHTLPGSEFKVPSSARPSERCLGPRRAARLRGLASAAQ